MSEDLDKGYELSDDFFDHFEEGDAQQGLNGVEHEGRTFSIYFQ